MIITRRIEVFVCENDKEHRKAYYDKLYAIRDVARDAANAATSHLFMLDNSIPYLIWMRGARRQSSLSVQKERKRQGKMPHTA